MKVRILEDANHRVSSGISQRFTASAKPISVPKATAEALIARGVAEQVSDKPSTEKE